MNVKKHVANILLPLTVINYSGILEIWLFPVDGSRWPHSFYLDFIDKRSHLPSKMVITFFLLLWTKRQCITEQFLIQCFKTKTEKTLNSVPNGSPTPLLEHFSHTASTIGCLHSSTDLNYYFYCTDNNYGYYYLSHEFWISFHTFIFHKYYIAPSSGYDDNVHRINFKTFVSLDIHLLYENAMIFTSLPFKRIPGDWVDIFATPNIQPNICVVHLNKRAMCWLCWCMI